METDKGQNEEDSQSQAKAPESEGSSPEQPETLTKAQHDELLAKAVQKARIDAGRDAKTLEQREKAIAEQEKKYQQWQREQEEAEEEKHRGDPDALKSLQEKRRLRQERDEIARLKKEAEDEKTANAEKLKRADELELEMNVWKAAQASGVDANTLKEKCLKFKLTDEEQISEMAETMAGGKAQGKQPLHADSNRSSGGGGIESLNADEKIAEGLRRIKKK